MSIFTVTIRLTVSSPSARRWRCNLVTSAGLSNVRVSSSQSARGRTNGASTVHIEAHRCPVPDPVQLTSPGAKQLDVGSAPMPREPIAARASTRDREGAPHRASPGGGGRSARGCRRPPRAARAPRAGPRPWRVWPPRSITRRGAVTRGRDRRAPNVRGRGLVDARGVSALGGPASRLTRSRRRGFAAGVAGAAPGRLGHGRRCRRRAARGRARQARARARRGQERQGQAREQPGAPGPERGRSPAGRGRGSAPQRARRPRAGRRATTRRCAPTCATRPCSGLRGQVIAFVSRRQRDDASRAWSGESTGLRCEVIHRSSLG